jgi:hypothetical protein
VLASADPALPLSQWTSLGGAFEYFPGQFQFTDTNSPALPKRFYWLGSP